VFDRKSCGKHCLKHCLTRVMRPTEACFEACNRSLVGSHGESHEGSHEDECSNCWNSRCDLVGNLRIHPAPHSSGASELRGFRVFDLPSTFSFLRSSYLLDRFNPIY